MSNTVTAFVLLPCAFLCIILFVEIGRWLGKRRPAAETERAGAVLVTVETAIYALLGLMVAFTFSGAASRFDTRRTLTVNEANAIGTAYLRVDLLPMEAQSALREKFRRYTEARLGVYQALPDVQAFNAHVANARGLQDQIWKDAVIALKDARPDASLLVLPALNEMIDITSTRSVIANAHTQASIWATLVVLTLACSLMTGHGLAGERTFRMFLHTVSFALVFTVTMYVIVDLDYPRIGFIRLDFADQPLLELLASMK